MAYQGAICQSMIRPHGIVARWHTSFSGAHQLFGIVALPKVFVHNLATFPDHAGARCVPYVLAGTAPPEPMARAMARLSVMARIDEYPGGMWARALGWRVIHS